MITILKRLGFSSVTVAVALAAVSAGALTLPPKVCLEATNPGTTFGAPSFFDVLISGGTTLDGVRDGWCLDGDVGIPDPIYTAEVLDGTSVAAQALVFAPGNIDLAAWVLNQGYPGQTSMSGGVFTFGDVQRAIWNLIDSTTQTGGLGDYSMARVNEIVSLALANGEGFVAACGQQAIVFLKPVATVCDLDQSGPSIAQNLVVTAPADCPPPPDPLVSSLGDKVWLDVDLDGVQSAADLAFPGVTVELRTCAGQVIATDTTDENGNYLFENLLAGQYQVRVVLPANYAFVAPDQGADDVDSDVDTTTGLTTCITLPGGVSDLKWDAGLYDADPTGGGECNACEGKVTELTLRYNGSTAAQVTITQKAKAKGTPLVIYNATVNPGQSFTFTGQDSFGTMGTEISISLNGSFHTSIHTSCSQPIGPGLVSGSFTVVSGRSLHGGVLCPVTTPPPPPTAIGTGTIGYWKTHPEAWPVDSIEVGDKTYSKADAINKMNNDWTRDKRDDFFRQLVAAKLNVLIGAESGCVDNVIAAGDAWWATYCLTKVRASSPAWNSGGGGAIMTTLDQYNNGLLCAPHRD